MQSNGNENGSTTKNCEPQKSGSTQETNQYLLTPDFRRRDGLIIAIVQDVRSKQVLMQAFMNAEAWQKTLETGEAWFWSTSRQSLWRKGATSGNTMEVQGMYLDCDRDSVLLSVSVNGHGAACHTGNRSCFYRAVPLLFQLPGISHAGYVRD